MWRSKFRADRLFAGVVAVFFFLLVGGTLATAQAPGTVVAAVFWPPLQVSEPGGARWDIGLHSAARLIAGSTAIDPASSATALGIEFRLEPGWKTYWRSPGDAGLPPEIDWSGSENLAKAAIQWPLPERETLFGFETFVYHDRVVLPVIASAVDPSRPIRLRAHVTYLVCEVLCVPAEATLALDLAPPPGTPTALSDLIASFAAKVPTHIGGDIAVERALLTEGHDGLALEVTVRAQTPFANPDLLVEGPRALRFGKPRFDPATDRLSGVFTVPVGVTGNRAALSAAMPFTFTLVDHGVDHGSEPPRALEADKIVAGVTVSAFGGTLGAILLLALAGGLILNLMPCVLPVLSMKILGVIAHADKPARAARLGFLATAAGIVVSMLALAGVAIAAKNAGVAVGWGVQFQAPAFLAAMVVVVAVFAASLLGNAELSLPAPVATLAGKGPRDGLMGSFLAGVFATLLATPCTAPLLGTAVGFALARGASDIVLVFAALGIGLAAPYLLVAFIPSLARALPRPGRWMGKVRIVLGIGLAATALWLLTSLVAQAGLVIATISGIAAVIAAVTFAYRGKGLILTLSALIAGVIAIAAPFVLPRHATSATVAQGPWRTWDRVEAINQVAAGKTVLVHVTADWCINCKVNQALVLDRGAVAARLKDSRIVPMIADWTRADPGIGRFLAGFGRYGIPFDVVYGPNAPAGIVLPEILTQDAVLAAFDAAGARR